MEFGLVIDILVRMRCMSEYVTGLKSAWNERWFTGGMLPLPLNYKCVFSLHSKLLLANHLAGAVRQMFEQATSLKL